MDTDARVKKFFLKPILGLTKQNFVPVGTQWMPLGKFPLCLNHSVWPIKTQKIHINKLNSNQDNKHNVELYTC